MNTSGNVVWLAVALLSAGGAALGQASGTPPSDLRQPIVLFNSGLDAEGKPLPDGAIDPHYILAESADVAFPGPEARVADASNWAYALWMSEGTRSRWITPRSDIGAGNATGAYRYRTSFEVNGLDPATVVLEGKWASDNDGLDILLNGRSTGVHNFSAPPFSAFASFTLTNGFVLGANTLDFIVHQAGAGTPTGLRVELEATALPVTDVPVRPPQIVISAPVDGADFVAGAPIMVGATVFDGTAPVQRVDFYAGTNVVGAALAPPYSITWTNAPLGEHSLTAVATDAAGRAASAGPVRIRVTAGPHVAVLAESSDPDVLTVSRLLTDLGIVHTVLPHENGVSSSELGQVQAVVWLQGPTGPPLTETAAAALEAASNRGAAIYVIGEGLPRALAEATETARRAWTELLHLQIDSTAAASGAASPTLAGQGHPALRGFFPGESVDDFVVEAAAGLGAAPEAESLAHIDVYDALIAFPATDALGPGKSRTLTQTFSPTNSPREASSGAREKLFQNAIAWLLGWTPCWLYSLDLQMRAEPAGPPGQVNLTMVLRHEGECDGRGIVVTNALPAALQFVRAATTHGTVEEIEGRVTFHVGHLRAGSEATLTVSALARVAGSMVLCASATGKGEILDDRNSACVSLEVTEPAETPPTLQLQLGRATGLELQISGSPGANYAVESSTDLRSWSEVGRVRLDNATATWFDPAGAAATPRFYRAVRR